MFLKKILYSILFCCCVLFYHLFATAATVVPLPQFALPSVLDGTVVRSESFKGKALLITFFATWCPPCRQEIPGLIKLQKDLSKQGFSVIGLSVDEGGAQVVAKLVESERINYPVLLADRSIAQSFGGIAGIPTSFLINKRGNVVKKYPGFVPHALLERDIKAVLK